MEYWNSLQISGFVERLCKYKEKSGCMSSNVYNIFNFLISLFHKFIYQWRGSTKYYRTGLRYHETHFYKIKNKKPYEQPNPWTWK